MSSVEISPDSLDKLKISKIGTHSITNFGTYFRFSKYELITYTC